MQPFSEVLAPFVPIVTGGTLEHEHGVDPANLSRFIPQGLGLGKPLVLRPWDGLNDFAKRGDYYGFDTRSNDPVRDAPSTDASGGVVYFDDNIEPADLDTLLRVLGVRRRESTFVVVCVSADKPLGERYLDQIRIFPPAALKELFGFRPHPRPEWPGEPITVGELVHLFVKLQRERWNTPGSTFSPLLRGRFGGDGDWAKESLAFGIMVENTSWGIYRFWSRAWLVTK